MNFLVDHNLGGHAELLLGNIASQGWLELLIPNPAWLPLIPQRCIAAHQIDQGIARWH